MGVTCQILIKKPKSGVHRPGNSVTGTVKYAIDEPTEYKDIVFSFLGKGKCSWTESSGETSTTYTGTEEYFTYRKKLLAKKTEEPTLIDAGCYEYDFKFVLPDVLPSTYSDVYCRIMYILKLKFYKHGFFTSDKRFTAEINVTSFVEFDVDDTGLIFGLDKKLIKLFSTKKNAVNLKAQVNRRCFNPGDVAYLIYEVANNTNIMIPKIKTELVDFKTYTANCGHKQYSSNVIKQCTVVMPSIPKNGIANLSNVITLIEDLYSLQNSKVFSKEYKLKVTVELPFPHLNAYTEAVIVVGEQFNGEGSVVDDNEPPSYWEVTMEDGDKNKRELS